MSDRISLLPEELRSKDSAAKPPTPAEAEDLRFSFPQAEGDEIEVIEIDEGDVDQVLANEPFLAKITYKIADWFNLVKNKLFQPQPIQPAPKRPPQFFKPPVASNAIAKPALSPIAPSVKAQIKPLAEAPRRVRVIRRVRKPLHVSFVSDEDLRLMRVNVPKRRLTLIVLVSLGLVLFVGSWFLLKQQLQVAQANLQTVDHGLQDTQSQITKRLADWSSFQDLEPKLIALSGLLDQHVSPSKLLTLIEQNTLPSVSYDSFVLSPDGRVSLSVTADSFESAAAQIIAFEQSGMASKVEGSGYTASYDAKDLSANPTAVRFQIGLTLKPASFHVSNQLATP